MKKKYFNLLCLFVLSINLYAQSSSVTTISQNIDQNNVTGAALLCWVSVPSSEFYGDYHQNVYARSFQLNEDHDIHEPFLVTSVEIGVSRGDDITGTINVYYADSRDLSDPENVLTLVESKEHTFFSFADEAVAVVFGWEALIPAGKVLVVEVDLPPNQEASDNGFTNPSDFKLFAFGLNDEGETHHGWFKAPNCDIDEYINVNNISANPQQIIINVNGQETLSVQNEISSRVELYPNPVENKLFVNLPKDIQIQDLKLVNVQGKKVTIQLTNEYLDLTGFSSGVYFLEINTNEGKYTQKIIKK